MTVICIGEALIELTRATDGRFSLDCSGDGFIMAVYLARAGHEVAFASAIGDDPYSDAIAAMAAAEGITHNHLLRVPGRLPGIRLVEGEPHARRSLTWRDAAPACDLFELDGWGAIAGAILQARMVYLSGITLSLYTNTGIGRLLAIIEVARRSGVKLVFDANFRPEGWRNDVGRARAVFIETLKRTDIALPGFGDEAALWGDASPEATLDRLRAFGIDEIAIKNGANGALIAAGETKDAVPVPEVLVPIDLSAAGEGFNAGYIAARLGGETPVKAATAGHHLAATVIRHAGAIIPRRDTAMH